jgi:hypothetical protein
MKDLDEEIRVKKIRLAELKKAKADRDMKEQRRREEIVAAEQEAIRIARRLGDGGEKSVYLCVDLMGCGDMSQEDEYLEIEKTFTSLFPNKFVFKQNIFPHALKNDVCDIYVFDFGGIGMGCQDIADSHFRELITQIEDHQNILFVIWSGFTYERYMDFVREESKELSAFHNVTYIDRNELWVKKVVSFMLT